MTRKTGKALQRARLQMRAARLARIKRELAEHGLSLRPQKPPKEVLLEKEKELMDLYQQLLPPKVDENLPVDEVIEPKKKRKEEQAG